MVNQDKNSAIFIEKNGCFSSSNRTKHIKTIYFFVKDKMDQGDIDIQYCPAVAPLPEDRMWSNVFNNPKSGREFIKDRSMIINYPLYYIG